MNTITTAEINYKSYLEARLRLLDFSRDDCINLMDDLLGTPENINDMSDSQVTVEALRQHRIEWMTPDGRNEIKYLKKFAKKISNKK